MSVVLEDLSLLLEAVPGASREICGLGSRGVSVSVGR